MSGEILHTKERPPADVAQPLAARAVALCEGCPVANLCATRDPSKCPPDIAQRAGSPGEMALSTLEPATYARQLNDNNQNEVWAGAGDAQMQARHRQPLPLQPSAPRLRVPHPKPPIRFQMPPTRRIVQSQTPVSSPHRPPARSRRTVNHKPASVESVPEQVADLLVGLLSVASLKNAHAKK